ncbi:MAG TPA: peroxiredoxin [Bdellovibrionales bacterium]|nr:peroxiredoxin [Bdellovibrionales bacterium]
MAKKKATKKTVAKKTTVKKATKKVAATTKKAAPKATKKSGSKSYKLKVGDKVPEFSLPATSGKTLSSAKLGQFVLYFYPKDNTPGCTLEGQDFARLLKDFEKTGTTVIGVSQDSVKSHESFRSKCGFPFDLISDEDGKLCKAFDVIQMKNMYGREFEGIERSTFVVAGGSVKAEWRKVRVEGHAQAVLDFVKGL